MGLGLSRTEIETQVKNTLDSDTYNTITNTCENVANAGQKISVKGSKGVKFKNISQSMSVEQSCRISSAIDALEEIDGTQDLVNKLQQAQDTSGLFSMNLQNTEVMNNITNEVDLNTFNTVRNECRSKFNAPQLIEAIDSEDVYLEDINQTNDLFNSCIQGSDIFQETKAKIDQKLGQEIELTQETTGLDLAAIANSMALPMIAVAVVLVVFLTVGASGGEGSGDGSGRGGSGSGGSSAVWVVGIIVILIILGVAGYFLYQEYSKTEAICNPECKNKGKCKEDPDNPGKALCECIGNFSGPLCGKCKEGWAGPECNTCDIGYSGSDCTSCAEGYVKSGSICIAEEAAIEPANNAGNAGNAN